MTDFDETEVKRAVLVNIDFNTPRFDEELDEFVQLVESTGLTPETIFGGHRDKPDARFFIGKGKVAEISEFIRTHDIDLVIFNHELTPAQERNLEKDIKCRVLDRVGLILDIFALRARSYEGKLQVELAQLQHLSTRLIRGWTHLERQKGGIGLRGPGETQLETDRRLIGNRIKAINHRLDKVRSQRNQGRKWRKRSGVPVVSLVGYTNAGKSTLFNRLSGADVYTADKLFATLDPTLRQVELIPGSKIILSDTVGFIRHIPHDLIQAFHATLEEVKSADMLLHVVDVNDEQRDDHIEQVNSVIKRIEADEVPQVMVFNKIDMSDSVFAHSIENPGSAPKCWISANTGEGLDLLSELIGRNIKPEKQMFKVHVPAEGGKLRARLFEKGAVRHEVLDGEGGWLIDVSIDQPSLEKIFRDNDSELSMIQ
ncbi:MAG: GTPase HflX [Gammaproteobacteria bacterium]|nr:GTPase HflX [Gammaproteobacteria bacterium]